ncbi:peptidase domain-containing ABC transporter [Chryseobacterium sp. Hurlbut01]|jgi:ATP-binding cassette subfamily B protein|uniref:peptidase domain-containing ABC transporter n=1 Tax=Chryseobacterium sp. Hurlbut01 TaxID=1681828 RepID=UPI00067D2633|nr:peptidase domain-containing ABC transporter [Chryseobacterium sp. Hurlbut01]KNB60095.1 ABC transporter ATP-binding protein [Chryseobacterium sp. Hurlbut01]
MKFVAQYDQMDCGPACLSMISNHYGNSMPMQFLRDKSFITREGVSLLGIKEAAENVGFETLPAKMDIDNLTNDLLPAILHWNQNHFVVLNKISTNFLTRKKTYKIADPGHGFITLAEDKVKQSWYSNDSQGIALFLEPTDKFFNYQSPKENDISFKTILPYLKPHKSKIYWMFLLLLMGTITTLIFPILTQKLIDEGVTKKDLNVITYILLGQLAFFFGNIIFEVIRNWITLTVGTKINIQILSDFLKKLLKLPIKFFDSKLKGDFNQRIVDHDKIEIFLTSQSLPIIFSVVTFSVFFGILWFYSFQILLVYIILTAFSVGWSLIWMRKRKILDYIRFQQRSENQESIYEMINGVSEMKLNDFEDYKRNEWEKIQHKLFKINMRILKLDQIQLSGFEFFNQLKNIVVTFLAAYFVIKGNMTIGALLSVSYIIGQMNSPINQLVTFFRSLQDAKLSLSRLNEVQNHPEEEKTEHLPLMHERYTHQNSIEKGIYFKNVSYQYEGPQSPFVLKDISLFIPEGKVTAIVGASGSGKTTLMKMLLKFYEPISGNIFYNHHDINDISPSDLRKNSGVVMQDGFIFSDTIERNIATSEENIDYEKLEKAMITANIKSFVDSLPLGLKTKIGSAGNGLSGGQKQRILIARAVYKDPHFILFDEATSALDAENEKVIHNNLQSFFKGKTVIVVAHRLSTVKNADQIIVLKNGEIIESGKHHELIDKKTDYYNLVRNQLEIGN